MLDKNLAGNTIRVLPESVANQIAAGEVIQRPASAVKELMENAIDAGASQIDVLVKDAGKSLIQVTDNGKGMSPQDAILAFERHATSKLSVATDLLKIRSMGFRGEALASIASVAQVELQSKRPEDELGTKVSIAGSKIENQETVLCASGSRFSVRNLFYNLPARRKFLGSNAKEWLHVRSEFIQIALAYPELQLSLVHNGESIFRLSPSGLRQRIVAIYGEQLNKKLFPIEVETEIVRISGFVGSPDAARKRASEQFFFVNRRFIRHPYFRKSILSVFEPLVPPSYQPIFFVYLEAAPDSIDVNIHPTKTEVKFEHEQIIWPILNAAVRQSLGKFHAVPSLDFDKENAPEIRVFTGEKDVPPPKVDFDPSYNPFQRKSDSVHKAGISFPDRDKQIGHWEQLYRDFKAEGKSAVELPQTESGPISKIQEEKESYLKEELDLLFDENSQIEALQTLFSASETLDEIGSNLFQVFGRYIVLVTADALLLIDQHRAQTRILFEQYSNQLDTGQSFSQTLLFPEILVLDKNRLIEFESIKPDLISLGFQFEKNGENYLITATPEHTQGLHPVAIVTDLLDASMESLPNFSNELKDKLALRLAKSTAIPYGQKLSLIEMKNLCQHFFDCAIRNHTPEGKKIILRVSAQEIIKRLN